jgi:hypothetical protein
VRFQPAITVRKGPRRRVQRRFERIRIVDRDLSDGLAVKRLHDLQHAWHRVRLVRVPGRAS